MNDAMTAYPLSWPTGWKRTPEQDRQRARFNRRERQQGTTYSWTRSRELTITDAIKRVLAELHGFGVSREDAIISTNLDLRLDGLPRSGQRPPADPGAAVYWLRNQNEPQRCMAIDMYDRVADNLAAIAATLAAMRAIERHGGAEILNRAFTGFAALSAPQGANWWDVLHVSRTAPSDEIRAAYISAAKMYHPDREGGDEEKFKAIQAAYNTATGKA